MNSKILGRIPDEKGMSPTYTQLLARVAFAVPIAHVAYKLIWGYIRRRAVHKTTVLNELPFLGKGRPDGKKIQGTAVIAGGSIAGLIAARVCSDYFDNVIIVEPDELSPGAKRTRIPQYYQSHGLLAISTLTLRAMFPQRDLDEALARFGAINNLNQSRIMIDGTLIVFKSSFQPEAIVCSRPCLEFILQSLVLPIPNVKHVRGLVQGVAASLDGQRIESVRFKPVDGEEPITLACAFLADCTGPACGAMKWVEQAQGAQWKQPKKSAYDAKIIYTTATVPIPERVRDKLPLYDHPAYAGGYENLTNLHGLTCGRRDNQGVGSCRVEGDRLMLTVGAWGLSVDNMPKTMPQFIELTDYLYRKSYNGATEEHIIDSLKMITNALEEDQVETNFVPNRMSNCYLVEYPLMESLPSNFAVLGDAILRVNPVYGHGTTKAIMDGATLNGALRSATLERDAQGNNRLPAKFQKDMVDRQMPRIIGCWQSTKCSDYGRSTTIPVEGETLEMGKFQREYGEAMLRVARNDVELSDLMIRSMTLLQPNIDLMQNIVEHVETRKLKVADIAPTTLAKRMGANFKFSNYVKASVWDGLSSSSLCKDLLD